ncbi:MAG: glutathione S-transferase family protein [Hyphomonadaceae bacterium]|nr:glutathione S-transferase family protein [Hyphomonadaceae bacterium]
MKFYWIPKTRAMRIGWLLEELGQPYERIAADEAVKRDPEFLAASPMGKVPALIDGPAKLWDSGAIALYLADAYPQAKLGVAVGEPKRAAFVQWCLYTNAVIEPAMMEKFSGAAPNKTRSGYGSFDLMLETLEAGLRPGPWILGDRFTAADVLVGSSVGFMKQFGALPDGRAALDAYVERCQSRPAYQRAASWDAAA